MMTQLWTCLEHTWFLDSLFKPAAHKVVANVVEGWRSSLSSGILVEVDCWCYFLAISEQSLCVQVQGFIKSVLQTNLCSLDKSELEQLSRMSGKYFIFSIFTK